MEPGKSFTDDLQGSDDFDLLARIEHCARATPDRAAYIRGDRILTYAELARQSDALAFYLAATLPDDDAPVAVRGHKEPEMLIGFLGAVKSGRPYLPLDLSIPGERVERIVENARAAITLTPARIAEIVRDSTQRAPALKLAKNDPFYIIYTSGSTGEPKGVVITLGCLTQFVSWLTGEQRFRENGEVFLNQAPFSFDLSVMDLYGALSTGGTLFSISRELMQDPAQLQTALANSGVTVWVSTPSFARLCLFNEEFSAGSLPQLRKFLFCGEVLAPETATQLLARFPSAEVWNTYGPTETTVAVTSVRIEKETLLQNEVLPVGRPMPASRIAIVGENGEVVPDGETGEIVIAGPMVSPGYLGREDLTARSFFTLDGQRAYRTGDHGRRRDGMLFFNGRIDGQVKIRGYRIETGEIESALREHPSVHDAAVIADDTGGEKRLVAYIVAPSPPTARAWRAILRHRLPDYMIPAAFVPVPSLPMTANGKLDRRALPAPEPSNHLPLAPTNPMEGRLVEIWERVLGVAPIGIADDFFELGGHSLLAVELMVEVEKTFGRKVPLSVLFKAPTIARLAETLAQAPRMERFSVIEELRTTGSRPPLFTVPGFLDLTRHLGDDQPCYGVHLTELEAMPETRTAVEDLAARCVREIRELQPDGPYYIAGHSFGGVIAFAIAQRLEAAGEKVALLALIDPDPPQPYPNNSLAFQWNRCVFHFRKLLQIPAAQRVAWLASRIRLRARLRRFTSSTERKAIERSHEIATSYRAGNYPGPITLFLARDTHLRQAPSNDPRLDWGAVAGGGLDLHELSGDHYTLIREPNVRELARQLRHALDRSRNGPGASDHESRFAAEPAAAAILPAAELE